MQIKGGTWSRVTRSRLINNAPDCSTCRRRATRRCSGSHREQRTATTASATTATESSSTASGATVTGNHITATATGSASSTGYAGARRGATRSRATRSGGTRGPTSRPPAGPAWWPKPPHSGLFGVVLSDNPGARRRVQYNLIQGRFQHGVLLTTGHAGARAALEQHRAADGRSTRERQRLGGVRRQRRPARLRNNLFAYTNPDALGAALMINDRSRLESFAVGHELVLQPDGAQRRLAWNGSRVTFGQWRTPHGSGRLEHRLAAAGASRPAAASPRATWASPAARPPRPRLTSGTALDARNSPTSGHSSTLRVDGVFPGRWSRLTHKGVGSRNVHRSRCRRSSSHS